MTTTPARALLQRLGRFLDGFSACFSRRPQREAASRYLDGLLNDSERKSMQAMHGRLSDPGQYQALQHFITDSLKDVLLRVATHPHQRLDQLTPRGWAATFGPHAAA